MHCAKVRRGALRSVRASEREFAIGVLCGVLALVIFRGAIIRAEDIKPQAQIQAQRLGR